MSAAALQREEWTARVRSLRDQTQRELAPVPELVAVLQQSYAGSAPLLCAADDGNEYWVKLAGNPQGTQTLVVETIVAELGQLISAPVIHAQRVRVPATWQGQPYGLDLASRIEDGLAHGSRLVRDTVGRQDDLLHLGRDDNARRMPRLLALWDWAMGRDEQWLYDESADRTIWSFDHGLWLDAAEGEWTQPGLRAVRDAAWAYPGRIPAQIDPAECYTSADRLEQITAEQIASAVSRVPRMWEPSDALLGDVAATLDHRRHGAAERSRKLGTRTSKGARR